MGSAESSERNGNNNSITSTDEERKDELKDMAKVAGVVVGASAAAYGVCSILASINKEEEDGPMMKASGQNGVSIKRKDSEDDPASYFKGNRGNILASINNKMEENGPMMKAPGQNGVCIKRKDIEDDLVGYFKGNRGNSNPHFRGAKSSINNNEEEEEDGPMMKARLGQKGEYIKRKDFEADPAGYFKIINSWQIFWFGRIN